MGFWTSLALDGSGYPHISYYDNISYYTGALKYAYRDASGWHIEIADAEGDVGSYTSLALDSSGWPHISYGDWSNRDLRYAYRNASGWHTETVDAEGDAGYYTSLALSSSGSAHISYYRADGDLKYAYATGVGVGDKANLASPRAIRLVRVCPNPASTHASILYTLGVGAEGTNSQISLKIYDSCGRIVAIPVDHLVSPGSHATRWNLRSNSGTRVPSGVYYLRILADKGETSDVGELVVLR